MRDRILRTFLALAVPTLAAAPAVHSQEEANVDEVLAYSLFYQASQAGDATKAVDAGREYLKKFPAGPNAEYIKTWLDKAIPQVRGAQFNKALKEGDVAEMIRVGREQLAEKPDDLAYLLSLSVNLRQHVLLGSKKDPAFEAAADEFTRKTLQLVEGGATPPGVNPASWKKETTLALLYQNLAILAQRAERSDEALRQYEKSLELGAEVAAVAGYSGFYCGKLRKDKYDAAAAAYQALPEEARTSPEPGPEVKAALEEANRQADAAIQCWAAFVGATKKNNPFGDVRATIEQALQAMYASRRPDDPAGLEALVAKYAEK